MQNRTVKNASRIIGCKIVQMIIGLVISMLTARYLGPENFGTINYASSVVAFATPIMSLGLSQIMVQEFVNSPDKEGETLGTSLLLMICSSLICMVGVIAFAMIVNGNERETIIVCALYSLILLAQAIEMIQYWYQAKLMSKYYSIVALIAYMIFSAYKIFLLATSKSVYWFAVSNALDYFLIGVALLVIYHKLGAPRLRFSSATAKRLLSLGKYYIVSNMMITIFAQTDRIMLKLMIDSKATGMYSAAVTCAGMTSFVFGAIIDSARPTILEKKKIGQKPFEDSQITLYSVIIYLSLAQSIFMTLLAKPIVLVLYGTAYAPSINALRLVVWYTTFSYLGAARNVWILTEGMQKHLWIINLSGALANVLLNVFMIPVWGIMGAALASLITQIFTNIIIGWLIKPICYNNQLLLKGFNPKYLFILIQSELNRKRRKEK